MISRIRIVSLMSCLAGACLAAAIAQAEVPRLMQYQGKLLLTTGAAVPGPITLRVRLYDAESDPSSLLFDETHSGLMLSNGLFSVLIGSQTPGGIPDSALAVDELYLGSSIDGLPEMTPRRRVVTTPYTVKAKAAEQLVRPDTLNPAVTVDGSGQVGIGTATPSERLSINGAITIGDTSNATPGAIRWTGSDFEGFNGTEWLSLTVQLPAELRLTPGNQTAMNVTGPGVPAYGSYVTFTVNNGGGYPSGPIDTSLANGANFEIGTDNCDGVSLSPGQSCTIQVRSRVIEGMAGPISDTLQIGATPGGEDTSSLSGMTSGFNPAQLTILTPDQTGMNVVGPGNPAYGSYVTVTVANTGDFTAGAMSTSLLSGLNFEIGTNDCAGVSLTGGNGCNLQVRPKATMDGALSTTLQVSASPGNSDSMSLSGTASNFPPPVLVIDPNCSCPKDMVLPRATTTHSIGGGDYNSTWTNLRNICQNYGYTAPTTSSGSCGSHNWCASANPTAPVTSSSWNPTNPWMTGTLVSGFPGGRIWIASGDPGWLSRAVYPTYSPGQNLYSNQGAIVWESYHPNSGGNGNTITSGTVNVGDYILCAIP